jgi:ABC-type transport system substrate-binding protein
MTQNSTFILKKISQLFLATFLTTCLILSAARGSELKILALKDGSNPYSATTSGDVLATFNYAVLGQLLKTNDLYELQPGLLKSWEWDPSDFSYKLYLKEGITFHDGTPIKSSDLEFTLLRGFFSKQHSFYEIYLGNILGVDKIKSGTKFSSGLVEGVEIAGPLSVKVKLKNPNPSFLYSLTVPFFSLVKRSALSDDMITWKSLPIGAGEYRVKNDNQEKTTLERVSNTDKAPNTIHLYKRISEGIRYDISYFDLSQKMKIFSSENPSAIFTLFFTNQNELSANGDFRLALKYGIDRSRLVAENTSLHPAYEFLTTNLWKNDKSLHTGFDLKRAKKYFSRIPQKLKSKTWRIPVFSAGELSEEKRLATTNLTMQFSKFGFKVKFYPSSEKFLSKTTATESPLKFSGRICDNIDPLLMFSSFKTQSPYKYDNSQNDRAYDKLYEEAAKAASTEDRVRTLRNLSKYTVANNFMIPLYESNQLYYYNPETVESFGHQNGPTVLQLDKIKLK